MRTVRIRRDRRTRARSPTTEVASTDARRTDIPCSVPTLANANDPNMDDQPKTRLICRRCAARMKLARQLPWLDHRLPAVLLFQCIDCGHVDMVEWPESEGEEAPELYFLVGCVCRLSAITREPCRSVKQLPGHRLQAAS